VSDRTIRHLQSTSSPGPQPHVHSPQITTDARHIPLSRSKQLQRPNDNTTESFRQDNLRLQQLEMTSQLIHAWPTQRNLCKSWWKSFHQISYFKVDDSRSGYSSTYSSQSRDYFIRDQLPPYRTSLRTRSKRVLTAAQENILRNLSTRLSLIIWSYRKDCWLQTPIETHIPLPKSPELN